MLATISPSVRRFFVSCACFLALLQFSVDASAVLCGANDCATFCAVGGRTCGDQCQWDTGGGCVSMDCGYYKRQYNPGFGANLGCTGTTTIPGVPYGCCSGANGCTCQDDNVYGNACTISQFASTCDVNLSDFQFGTGSVSCSPCDLGDPCYDYGCSGPGTCTQTPNTFSQGCYTGPGGTVGVGVCVAGTETCNAGSFGSCVGEVTPSPEVCDGLDNDCNGAVDDGLSCTCIVPLTQACWTGAPAARNVGECSDGSQVCLLTGIFDTCIGETLPQPETCDGLDNDCDGNADGFMTQCYTGPPATENVGDCRPGTTTCSAGSFSPCAGEIVPNVEVCDGMNDENCDGTVDEGCACVDGETRSCYSGPIGTEDIGLCGSGFQVCANGAWGTCQGSTEPTAEACNGTDDNCDGTIDEGCGCGSDRACYSGPNGTLGVGECANGTQTCLSDATYDECLGSVTPTVEINDGLDNDCDGSIDEGLVTGCLTGQTQACYTGPPGTASQGICSNGIQYCDNGVWGECTGDITPRMETCDGIDEDCDGTPDNGCTPCAVGTYEGCYPGPEGTAGVGLCIGGERFCSPPGVWGVCSGATVPDNEQCANGIDENCNGVADDGCASCVDLTTQQCYTGPAKTRNVGACVEGTSTCTNSEWGTCVGDITPSFEICDGIDNDCDGAIDDDLSCGCTNGESRSCYGGPNGTLAVGLCAAGVQTCQDGAWLDCVGDITPQPEIPDGLDNDCDGANDNGVVACTDSDMQPCYTGSVDTINVGECAAGMQTCTGGVWGACVGELLPDTESANGCDVKDNDCDGLVDEGQIGCCTSGTYTACYPANPVTQGVGVCQAGTQYCANGRLDSDCVGAVTPTQEVCDGLDNDCDGVTDENCVECVDGALKSCYSGPPGSQNTGACSGGYAECIGGEWQSCFGEVLPTAEVADGVDNNCDGSVDEGVFSSCTVPQNCYSGPVGTSGVGICQTGFQDCQLGILQACEGEITPEVEVCDGLDNDCDGSVDEAGCVPCAPNGSTEACYTGSPDFAGIGECIYGTRMCGGGSWGSCSGDVMPTVEACDFLDNDCDGVVDNGCSTCSVDSDCGLGEFCVGGFCEPEFGPRDAEAIPTVNDSITDMRFADFDEDGQLDIVVGYGAGRSGTSSFEVLLANPPGSPTPFTTVYTGPDLGDLVSIAVGDCDNDDDPDLLIHATDPGDDQLFVMRNNSNATSWDTISYGDDDATEVYGATWADLNGDGELDIVSAFLEAPAFSFRFYDGLGNCSFGSGVQITNGIGPVEDLEIGDVNADGQLDLVTISNGQVSIRSNYDAIANSFPTADSTFGILGRDPVSLSIGDFTQDGVQDIAVAYKDLQSRVFVMTNAPTPTAASTITFGNSLAATHDVVLGDVDGDGALDILECNGNPAFFDQVLTYTAGAASSIWTSPFTLESLACELGDFDNDGDLDMMVGNSGGLTLLKNYAGTLPKSADGTVSPAASYADELHLFDAEGDLDLDLIVVELNNTIRWYRNSPPFSWNTLAAATFAGTDRIISVDIGDWDADDDMDIITLVSISGGADMALYFVPWDDTATTFDTPVLLANLGNTAFTKVLLADYDNFGDLDIILVGTETRYYRQDDPTTITQVGTPNSSGPWSDAVVADLDISTPGPEIVLASAGGDNVEVFHFDDLTTPIESLSIGDVTTSIDTADFNGDGYFDVVIGTAGAPISVFYGDGTGSLPAAGKFVSYEDVSASDISVADMNMDGHPDFIVATGAGEGLTYYLNDGSTFERSWVSSGTFGGANKSIITGDIDLDGDPDVVSVNSAGQTAFAANRFQGITSDLSVESRSNALPNQPPAVRIYRVGAPEADGYSATRKINGPIVPVMFTLSDPEGDPVSTVRLEFWDDGSGWKPATMVDGSIQSNVNNQLIAISASTQIKDAPTSFGGAGQVTYYVNWDAGLDNAYSQQMRVRVIASNPRPDLQPRQYNEVISTSPQFRLVDPCDGVSCSGAEVCVYGSCFTQCTDSTDCTDLIDDTCYLDTGFCNNDNTSDPAVDACTNINCPLGQSCYSGACYTTCFDDGDCTPPFYCSSNICIPNQPGPTDDQCYNVQCPEGYACYGGNCYVSGCTANTDCGLGTCFGSGTGICDTDDDLCNNISCAAGYVCYEGSCYASCSDNGDCTPPSVCLNSTFCSDASNPCDGVTCPIDQVCASGSCFPLCGTTADCSDPDDVCFNNACRDPDSLCEGVLCPTGQTCHGGACYPVCANAGDCAATEACYAEVTGCTTPIGYDLRWIGALDTNWDDPQNWVPTNVPTSSDNVYICGGVTQPQLQSNTTINDLLLGVSAAIDENGYTLNVNGAREDTQFCQDDSDACQGITCPTNYSCWQGSCYLDCTDNGDCTPPYVCYDGIGCTADPCAGVACPLGYSCYQGSCYTSCGSDLDCTDPAYAYCFGGRCTDSACSGVQCEFGEDCTGGTCYVSCALNTDCPNYTGTGLTFIDVASAANIVVTAQKGGSTAGDLNNDGWLDISVSTRDNNLDTIFFRNNATLPDPAFNQFARCDQAGAENYEMDRSQIIADFNNDGWNDYMHNSTAALNIYLNDGMGRFPWTKRTNACPYHDVLGDDLAGGNLEGVVAIDYDGDRDVDLIGEDGNSGYWVYRNETCSGGTCGNPWSMSRISGTTIGLSGSFGNGDFCTAADFDVDGDVDLLCRKDGTSLPDLYINDGTGNFSSTTSFNQPASNSNKGGLAFCDFDNDGDFDIFWSEAGANQIWEQTAPNTWAATGEPLASAPTTLSQIDGVACGDVDNDGDVDLFLSGNGDDHLFLNKGGTWERRNIGITGDQDGESVLMLDYDRSGSLDVFINQDNQTQLWRNPRQDNRYLILRALVDFSGTTRDAIGATFTIRDANGDMLGVREVNGGKGHGSQDPAYVHYGLPYGADVPYSITVQFPHGPTVEKCIVPSSIGGYQLFEIADTDTNDTTACTPGWEALIELPAADPTASEFCYDDYCAYGPCDGIQCSSESVCYGGNCKDVCSTNADCPAGEICDGGKCVDSGDPECDGGDYKCPVGWDCIAGECFPLCNDDTECDTGSFCYDGICVVDDCSFKSCGSGQSCHHGVCFTDCVNDAGCAAGESCYEGRCAEDGCLALTDTFESTYHWEGGTRTIFGRQNSSGWFWPRPGEVAGQSVAQWVDMNGASSDNTQVPAAGKARVALYYESSSNRYFLWFNQGAKAGSGAAIGNYRIRLSDDTDSTNPDVVLADNVEGYDVQQEQDGNGYLIHAQITTGANETGGFVVGPLNVNRTWTVRIGATFAGDINSWEFWDPANRHVELDTREEITLKSENYSRDPVLEPIIGPDSRMPCVDSGNALLDGICQRGFGTCNQIRRLDCTPTVSAWQFEVCDGLDNDCDGTVDEFAQVNAVQYRQRSDQEWTTWPTIDEFDGVQNRMNFVPRGGNDLQGSPNPQRVDGSGTMLAQDYSTLFPHRDLRDGSVSMAIVHGAATPASSLNTWDAEMRIQWRNSNDTDDEASMAWFDDRDQDNGSSNDRIPREVEYDRDYEYKYDWRVERISGDREADGAAWRSMWTGHTDMEEMEIRLEWTKDEDDEDDAFKWRTYIPRRGTINLDKRSNKDFYWRVSNVPLSASECVTANPDPFVPTCYYNRYQCVGGQLVCPTFGTNSVCNQCGDSDGDGFDAYDPVICTSGRDCNDNPADPAAPVTNPTAPEICDGLDNDCDDIPDVKDDAAYMALWGEARPVGSATCDAGTKCGPEECNFNFTCVCPDGPEEFGIFDPSTDQPCACGEGLSEPNQSIGEPSATEPEPVSEPTGFEEPDSACSTTGGSSDTPWLLVLMGLIGLRARRRR